MRKSLKAALFSALLFPGSGHFFLKKHVRAALLAGVSIACVYALLSTAVAMAQEISVKIQSGEIPFDVTRITEEVSKQTASSGTQLADISTYLLAICWLVGIVDSYRVGRLQNKDDSSRDKET
jgi:hypothetical protein